MKTVKGTATEATAQDESSFSTAKLPPRETLSPLLEQITILISQLNNVRACRIVEVSAKHQKDALIAQGHKPEPSVSITTKTEHDGEEAFYEAYGENGKLVQHRIGKTFPPDYDISDKKLSKRAKDRLEQLTRQYHT